MSHTGQDPDRTRPTDPAHAPGVAPTDPERTGVDEGDHAYGVQTEPHHKHLGEGVPPEQGANYQFGEPPINPDDPAQVELAQGADYTAGEPPAPPAGEDLLEHEQGADYMAGEPPAPPRT